ncbi:MAG: restriction endonuclease [Undibacterium sp.]|nr:restriction endonuclease [Undibacterium sp.]
MPLIESIATLSPREYEIAVKSILERVGVSLSEFSTRHLEKISGFDGSYIIDVTARFNAIGADFLVLVECKHERRKVERQDVQVLHDKVHSTGAQKGMLFSVAGFQEGAIKYADVHGIALVQLADAGTSWFTRSIVPPSLPLPRVNIPKYIGWWCHGNSMSVMSSENGEYTRKALGIPADPPEAK